MRDDHILDIRSVEFREELFAQASNGRLQVGRREG
jgi:hypothetical protein